MKISKKNSQKKIKKICLKLLRIRGSFLDIDSVMPAEEEVKETNELSVIPIQCSNSGTLITPLLKEDEGHQILNKIIWKFTSSQVKIKPNNEKFKFCVRGTNISLKARDLKNEQDSKTKLLSRDSSLNNFDSLNVTKSLIESFKNIS